MDVKDRYVRLRDRAGSTEVFDKETGQTQWVPTAALDPWIPYGQGGAQPAAPMQPTQRFGAPIQEPAPTPAPAPVAPPIQPPAMEAIPGELRHPRGWQNLLNPAELPPTPSAAVGGPERLGVPPAADSRRSDLALMRQRANQLLNGAQGFEMAANQPWATATAQGVTHTPIVPFQAEGLRQEAANILDEFSPEERQAIEEQTGLKIPLGMTRTQFQSFMQGLDPYEAKRAAIGEQQLGLARDRSNLEREKWDFDRGMLTEEVPAFTRNYLKERLGVDIPAGTNMSQLQSLTGSLPSSAMDPYAQMKMDLRLRNTMRSEQTEQRLREQQKERNQKWTHDAVMRAFKDAQIPDVDMRKGLDVGYTIRRMNWMRDNFDQFSEYIGPIVGRWYAFVHRVGLSNAEIATAMGEMVDTIGAYLTQQTGAQRGMTEVAWLKQALPQFYQNPETFKAMLEQAIGRTEERANTMISVQVARQRDPSPFYYAMGKEVPPEYQSLYVPRPTVPTFGEEGEEEETLEEPAETPAAVSRPPRAGAGAEVGAKEEKFLHYIIQRPDGAYRHAEVPPSEEDSFLQDMRKQGYKTRKVE